MIFLYHSVEGLLLKVSFRLCLFSMRVWLKAKGIGIHTKNGRPGIMKGNSRIVIELQRVSCLDSEDYSITQFSSVENHSNCWEYKNAANYLFYLKAY